MDSRPTAADAAGADGAQPAAGMLPEKPKFAPLSAHEQNGKKLEFRRVRARQPVSNLKPHKSHRQRLVHRDFHGPPCTSASADACMFNSI